MRVYPMDSPFAAIWCVSMRVSLAYSEAHLESFYTPNVQSNPTVKAAKDDAFKEAVEWLIKYLE
jgi:hypothetical protein